MVEVEVRKRMALFDDRGRRLRSATPIDLLNYKVARGGYYVLGHGLCYVKPDEEQGQWFDNEFDTRPKA